MVEKWWNEEGRIRWVGLMARRGGGGGRAGDLTVVVTFD